MTEITAEGHGEVGFEEGVKDPRKRKTLKSLAKAALLVGSGEVARELLSSEGIPRVETKDGVFYMLYEEHAKGISPQFIKALPNSVGIFWSEGVIGKDRTGITWFGQDRKIEAPKETIYNIHPIGLAQYLHFARPELLDEVGRRQAEIAFGDIDVSQTKEEFVLIAVDEALAGTPFSIYLAQKGVESIKKRKPLTRRDFLKMAGAAGGFAATSLGFTGMGVGESDSSSIGRILQRFVGFQSHLHPELALVFYRNAMWADKLLTIVHERKQKDDKKVEIACNIGAGHAGIEDFLKAGRDFCRVVLTRFYPAEFIREAVILNGGIKNFCSSHIIQVKKTDQLAFSAWDKGMITDEVLMHKVEEKLNETNFSGILSAGK